MDAAIGTVKENVGSAIGAHQCATLNLVQSIDSLFCCTSIAKCLTAWPKGRDHCCLIWLPGVPCPHRLRL